MSFSWRKRAARKILKIVKEVAIEHDDKAYVVYVDLMIEHMRLLEKESEYTQELYMQIIARTFNGSFEKFIAGSTEDDVYGWAMTRHNTKVQAEFIIAGINIEQWLDYKYEISLKVTEGRVLKDRNLLWKVLDRNLDLLLGCFQNTQFYGSFRKDCIEIRKKKALILNGEFLVPESWVKALFPKFHMTCQYFGDSIKTVKLNNITVQDFEKRLSGTKVQIESFYRNPVEKEFRVRLWRRDPRVDLFQGNSSNCCVAIGDKNLYPAVHLPEVNCRKFPAGILNYLTDLGVQVAEVIDMDPKGPYLIGQCWLFVSLDEAGKPVLVADSFDIHYEYLDSESRTASIRDCMFEFLKNYASKCGISKVVLGREGPVVKRDRESKIHVIHNDVSVENLPVMSFQKPIEKLGGYFLGRPYFLETRGGKSAYLIAENLPVTAVARTEESLMKLWRYISGRELVSK